LDADLDVDLGLLRCFNVLDVEGGFGLARQIEDLLKPAVRWEHRSFSGSTLLVLSIISLFRSYKVYPFTLTFGYWNASYKRLDIM
jgi:hypothetical protein